MTQQEYRRLMAYYVAAKASRNHGRRNAASKRSTKSRANHVGTPLKQSRVFSISPDKLRWSAHSYKALNTESNLRNQAS